MGEGLMWQGHMRTIGDFVTGGRTLLAIGKPSVLALELLKRLRDCSSCTMQWMTFRLSMQVFPALP